MMKMSLQSLVRSQWWWAVVLVLWVLALFGIFPGDITGVNIMVAFPATILVATAKAVEYLTRPDQTARQAPKMHKNIK